MVVCYTINKYNGFIDFLSDIEIENNIAYTYKYRYCGYTLKQALKQFRIDNNLRYKHIEFINID